MSDSESDHSENSLWGNSETRSEFDDADLHNHFMLHLLNGNLAGNVEEESDLEDTDLYDHLMLHMLNGELGLGVVSDEESDCEEAEVYNHIVLNMLNGDLGSNSEDSTEMDAAVWGQMPGDILERVLVKLPVASNFRFRTICKEWLALLSSSSFLKQCAPTVPHISAFQLVSNKDAQTGTTSSSLTKAYNLDLSFIPTSISSVGAADKGLICFCTFPKKHNKVALYVCNPMLKVWKALPEFSLQDEQYWESALVVNPALDSFQVIVVCGETDEDCSFWTVHVYSSQTDAWKTFRGDPTRAPFFGDSYMVVRDSILYHVDADDLQVVLYNLLDGKLVRKRELQLPINLLTHSALVQFGEDVLLVGDLWNANAYATFGIWKLDQRAMIWEEVSILPDEKCAELAKDWDLENCKAELVGGVAIGGVVCLDVEVSHYFNQSEGWKYALAFDMVAESWKIFHIKSLTERGPSVFEPRLDVIP